MGDGYSRSPKLLKGALVKLVDMTVVPIPKLIVFQYNPDSLQRTLQTYTPPEPPQVKEGESGAKAAEPVAQPYDPAETFNLTLFLDASDALEAPERHPIAFVTGVADRIAALEMLLYPVKDTLLGKLGGVIGKAIGGGRISARLETLVQCPEVPVTLFVWGPGRIVPVRLTTFSVEEQQWNQLLYPTRAKVTLGLKIITGEAFGDSKTLSTSKKIAKYCYEFTRGQKEVLALANVANTVESFLGIP